MDPELLRRAHRLYDLQGESVERFLAADPTFAALAHRLARAEARLAQGGDPEQVRALAEARRLMMAMLREAAFKLGYVLAHTYPLDEKT
jgi:hypothetical protein